MSVTEYSNAAVVGYSVGMTLVVFLMAVGCAV